MHINNLFNRRLITGNPTGQVLTRDNIENIIKFAYENSLFIFADEVYQHNVYAKNSKFYSFKQVQYELGEPYRSMELASFMSCSKGYMGECGIRGGYCELINIDPTVRAMYQKSISASLCATTVGQAAIDAVVNPPKKGEPSYDQWLREKTAVLESLRERAELIANTFNSFEGFSCNQVQGAMYAFPQIHLPPKAIAAAEKEGKSADVFYAFQLLESTGKSYSFNRSLFSLLRFLIILIFNSKMSYLFQVFVLLLAVVLAKDQELTISAQLFYHKLIN